MKKELLVATALVTSMGMVASTAQAASATFSGKSRVGVVGKDSDSANATYSAHEQASFSVSISETTDAGTKISTGFDLTDENDAATDVSGLTLTFTDSSALDLIEAGNAAASKLATVPGASGEQGIVGISSNSAKLGIDAVGGSNNVGIAWHSAADAAGVDGLSFSVSFSNGDETTVSGATVAIDNSLSAGVTYVTTSGDTTVTLGAGMIEADDNNLSSTMDTSVYHVGAVAVNGDLTVGIGVGGGDYSHDLSAAQQEVADWE